MRKYIFWSIFVLALIFSRFYNLDTTARFTEDESKDLVGMHQIYVDKKLTLVGPTNEQGTKVFSSLTFYMLMPFAAVGKFNPVSPHYGAAFWGVVSAFLIIFATWKINPRFTLLVAAICLTWFPLLEMSRWAWNPNLIPLWIISGILLIQHPNKYVKLIAGIAFGFAVHSHYYSIFAVGFFMILYSIYLIYTKKYIEVIYIFLGFALSISPFVIFDLRHPPGIFISNLFSQSKSIGGSINLILIFNKLIANIWSLMLKYTQTLYLAVPLLIFTILLAYQDIRKKSFTFIYFVVWLFQLLIIAFIPQFFPHYLIPAIVYFLVWIISKRKGFGNILSYVILLIIIMGGIMSIYPQLTKATSVPNISIAREIETYLKTEIVSGNLKNVNIAVLASSDPTASGKKYRDLLLVDGNIHILTKDEYDLSDHLFVISTSTEKVVRSDPANEIHRFRKGPIVDSQKIGSSEWVVYHFTR